MSCNPYADAGYKNPELWLQKADIVSDMRRTMQARGLTPSKAARMVRMPLPEFREIIKGHFGGVGLLTIAECARRLGHDVEISYAPLQAGRLRRGSITLHTDRGPVTAR